MKKIKLIITIVTIMMAIVVGATITSSDQDVAFALGKIAESSEATSINTVRSYWERADWDEWATLIFSFIAALGTFLTWFAIKRETKQQEIKRRFQEKIFRDLIRHLYRNKVCVCATHWELQKKGFDKFYPSEEHLLKLKVLPEDLRFDRFDNTPDYYDILHELELKFRNYNIEVDVTLEHLKIPQLSEATKKRDLNTLEWKSGFLTKEIIELMNKLKFKVTEKNIREQLVETSERYSKNNEKIINIDDVPPREDRNRYYDDILQITEYLNEDIAGESSKISLIPF